MLVSQDRKDQLRIEPPNWWVGFNSSKLQLLIQGDNIGTYNPKLTHDKVRIRSWQPGDSLNYLFVDLEIGAGTTAGRLEIILEHASEPLQRLEYELLAREGEEENFEGFTTSDVIYLITPDRFANGNPAIDSIPGMREQGVNREEDYARHGGDIRGIIQHLDYISEMGFTAVWPSPLLVNDMPEASYHGYAITDFYMVDPRFGTLEDYKELVSEARRKGIKIVMDQVVNHCGLEHWWMKDLPFSDWIHYQQDYLSGKPFIGTNHRRTVNQDNYAAKADKAIMNRGWFVPSMPDLNQSNSFMATYLIQNSIWWIETLGVSSVRQDTYSYPEKAFMAEWASAVMREYPNFSIVGEEWSYNPLLVAYWQDGASNKDGYRSYLKSTMDFPMQRALVQALVEDERSDRGLIKLYEALANDFHYSRPQDLLLFGDNHDIDRLFTQLNEDLALMEMALAFILTAPRIPQIYYGTEVLLQNSTKRGDHGLIRSDFPGGWDSDAINAFTGEGLSPDQKKMQDKLRRLLNFRKTSEAIRQGATVHFAPEQGIYVMTRSGKDQTVVLLLNKNQEPVQLELERFEELDLQDQPVKEIISGDTLKWNEALSLKRKGAFIFVLTH
ncbi:glycoside hydrolase family 13 protein [Poritiphilus flavus]|uniref:Alpha-amylase n=1 Tax=Poritiphilus flavus TaxID=2697053 RepID=A0A6L9EDK5_9FLAO|nr:glycoside hydrolase family 13 protein [Poritiphilus flavus]NAS12753.1 alpha-amylase [Poritiphilus flavus]